jgi:hypothetical protein
MRRTRSRFTAVAALLSLAAACGDGAPTVTVTVNPAAAFLGVGLTQQFTATVVGAADQTVTWTVTEALGGTISTTGGLYTAPLLPGSFHVVATSVADVSKSGTAAVSVVPPPACTLEAPQPSALPSARVLQLGVHTVGETVTFTVPASTGSVTILQQGTEPLAPESVTYKGSQVANTVVPLTVKVGGVEFFNDNVDPTGDPAYWGTKNGIGSIFFDSASPWTGTMTIPNTTHMLDYVVDHGGVPAGTWSVVVNDTVEECKALGPARCVVGDGNLTYPPGKYDVKVLLKPGAVPAAGTIDVNFYLVTTQLTAASASTSASVARMRQTLAGYFAPTGLTLGTVTFVDMTDDVKSRYAAGVNIDDTLPCGDIASILRMSSAENAMSLFLVNSLVSNQGGTFTFVGIDGTIPGPSSVGGTVASGALVSVANLNFSSTPTSCQGAVNLTGCGADVTAYIAAHETGHFLGLYHVTESDGTRFDPVQDTPTCKLSLCAPTATEVVNANCTKYPADPASPCGGGENLMFWLLDRTVPTGKLSPQQSSIMRANPLVR